MLETSANTKSEPIPSAKQAIQLVMDDAGATEEALDHHHIETKRNKGKRIES